MIAGGARGSKRRDLQNAAPGDRTGNKLFDHLEFPSDVEALRPSMLLFDLNCAVQ